MSFYGKVLHVIRYPTSMKKQIIQINLISLHEISGHNPIKVLSCIQLIYMFVSLQRIVHTRMKELYILSGVELAWYMYVYIVTGQFCCSL